MADRVRIYPGFEALVESLGLTHAAAAPEFSRGELVKSTGTSRVLRFRDPEESGDLYYLKLYRYPHLRPRIKYALRRSRARVEFDALVWLQAAGLPGVVPVACGSHRVCRMVHSSFLLTRGVEGAKNLDQFLPAFNELERTPTWLDRKRQGIKDLAALIGRMHQGGFYDGDLFFRNILTAEPQDPTAPLPWWFLDHPTARVISPDHPAARHEATAVDLACLDLDAARYVSRPDRLRFFLAARGASSCGPEERKLLGKVHEVCEALQQKRDRKQERRRRKGRSRD